MGLCNVKEADNGQNKLSNVPQERCVPVMHPDPVTTPSDGYFGDSVRNICIRSAAAGNAAVSFTGSIWFIPSDIQVTNAAARMPGPSTSFDVRYPSLTESDCHHWELAYASDQWTGTVECPLDGKAEEFETVQVVLSRMAPGDLLHDPSIAKGADPQVARLDRALHCPQPTSCHAGAPSFPER